MRGICLALGLLGCTLSSLWAKPIELLLQDHLNTPWSQELIGHAVQLDKTQKWHTLRVIDDQGRHQPAQLSDVQRRDDGTIASCKVWFIADLPANGSARYLIEEGRSKASAAVAPHVRISDGVVDLLTDGNGGVRLLHGQGDYSWPQPFSDDLAPIQKLLLPSGRAVGRPQLQAPFRVKQWRSEVLADGPVFSHVRIEYLFDVGYWTLDLRTRRGSPLLEVQDEFNTGPADVAGNDSFFTFHFTDGGFAPTQGWYAGRAGVDGSSCNLLREQVPPSWAATGGVHAPNFVAALVSGYNLRSTPHTLDYGLTGWYSSIPHIGCFYRLVEPDGEAVGLASVREMNWRNPIALRIGTNERGEMAVRLPIRMLKQQWSIDGFGAGSPNYTGITLYVPADTSRRHWALMLSKAEDEAQARLESLMHATAHIGAQTLDEVRHWTLDWPDPMKSAEWTNQPTEAGTAAVELMRARTRLHRMAGNAASFSMGNHFAFAKRVHPMLAVLNDPKAITVQQRTELRRLIAFEAYRQNSDDLFPYGAGMHLNNPNMTVMAVEAGVRAASLLPDHPQFRAWGQRNLALMREFFRRFTMPSGAPYENPHYTMGVTFDWAALANDLLREAGIGDAFDDELFKSSIRFVMNWLSPPDLRFKGHRTLLPLGNCSYQSVPPTFGQRIVAYYKDRDPQLAAQLQWFANSTLAEDKQIRIMPSDAPPPLTSGWWKDYGVIFRHGFGTEHETLLHLLAGKCFGHYEAETDHMAYTLYAKGHPIHLHFGNGYFPMYNRPWLRNRVSFDMCLEMFERNSIGIDTAMFGPHGEYTRATRQTDQLLAGYPEYPSLNDKGLQWSDQENRQWTDLVARPPRQVPMITWRRQIAFLKDADPAGPNYFVLRDSFEGIPSTPTELNLWFLANTMQRQGDLFSFDGQVKVDMDVFVHTPASPEVHTDRYGHLQQGYARMIGFDPAYHPEGKLAEQQMLLRLKQPPGQGYLLVLYPRLKQKDEVATFTRLSDVAVRVQTPLSDDTVLMGSTPSLLRGADFSLNARAAALRHYRDGKRVLANFEGPCEASIGSHTVRGSGAFTITLDKDQAQVTHQDEGASVQVD